MLWNDELPAFFICLLLALFVGGMIDLTLQYRLGQHNIPLTAHISIAVTAVFLCKYGFTFLALRSILLCLILLMVGVFDYATHEIPDSFHVLIGIVGLISFHFFPALLGMILVPLPFLAAAVKTGKIGGGDIKLMSSCGFAIGVVNGIWMMIWGLSAVVIWNFIFYREEKAIPLAPFLTFGCFMALVIN